MLTASDEAEALQVIEETALRENASLTRVTEADTCVPPLAGLELPLLGQHQRLNAALAVATVRLLDSQIPVSEKALISGLRQVTWPGRLQLITEPSGRKLLLDGAHNPAGAESLAAAWKEHFGQTRPALMFGVLRDKDVIAISRILAPLSNRILLLPVSSERTAVPAELQVACQEANPSSETLVCSSVGQALELTAHESFVIVTGSLYLVGEVLELLQGRPNSSLPERSLNEWSAKK